MDELTHRQLMQICGTSRVATADVSDFRAESSAQDGDAPSISDMLEMGLEALLSQFRRK